MAEILLVNPARRPSKRRVKKAASPAQKRARAKFAAMSRARAKGATVMANPKRRRRNPAKRKVRARVRHRNPAPVVRSRARRHSARRRRNPIGMNGTGKPLSLLTPALVGALGATAVNTIYSNIASALPASLTTGTMVYATRAALSLGLAMLAPHAGSKKAAVLQAAEGSLTVTLHDAIVALSGGMGMALSGVGVYMPGRSQQVPRAAGRPAVQMSGMGAYISGSGSPQAAMARQVPPAQKLKGIRF
jgi:hypothetical protein